MNREAEEFRISSDIKQANLDVMRDQLNEAVELLQGHAKHGNTQGWRESVAAFLASQQGEQCITPDGNECPGDGVKSCKKCPEQAEGAQVEREAFEAWFLRKFYEGDMQCGLEWLSTEPCGGYRHRQPAELWEVWKARAALAQPSPAEDMSAAQELAGVKAILNDMADALKRLTFHARTTGGTAGPDTALMNACESAERILSLGGMGAAFMRGCDEHESQPSPAPELERPEVPSITADLYEIAERILGIAEGRPKAISTTLMAPVRGYRLKDAKATARVMGERLAALADRSAQYDRIVGALRAEIDRWKRNFKVEERIADQWEAKANAAQARVAELEKQEPVAEVSEETFSSDGTSDIITCNLPIGTKLYATPVAQAGQVPAIQVCKLGIHGKAYDLPETKRAYTYAEQPDNLGASRLGTAATATFAATAGDHIDRGLVLLRELQGNGFGVFELAAAPAQGGSADE